MKKIALAALAAVSFAMIGTAAQAGEAWQMRSSKAGWCKPLVNAAGDVVKTKDGALVLGKDSVPCPETFVTRDTTFVAHFAMGSKRLDKNAQAILADAAAAAKAGTSVKIDVVGHTDRVGSARSNERLSLKRAAAAADRLVALGVPVSVISVSGKGETINIVPTQDGVAAAANRRVETTIHDTYSTAPAPKVEPMTYNVWCQVNYPWGNNIDPSFCK